MNNLGYQTRVVDDIINYQNKGGRQQQMSLFEAEVRRRTGEEDLLTSKVFGSLSILDRKAVLLPFLRSIGFNFTENEIPSLKIELWNIYGNVEPDVIIESSQRLAFIEVKLDSPSSREQLEKEYRQGSKIKKQFSLLLLTKDSRIPQAVIEAKEALIKDFLKAEINWMRWQQIYPILQDINKGAIDQVSHSLLSEILRLLESKSLRGTTGIRVEWLANSVQSQESLSLLCEEIAIIAQELTSRAVAEGIDPVTPGGSSSNLDRDGRGSSLWEPSNWFTKYLELAYKDSNWVVTQFYHRHLYVRFYLGREEVDIGFIIICNSGNAQRDILDKQHLLFKKLNQHKGVEMVLIPLNTWKSTEEVKVVDSSSTLDAEMLRKFQWLDLKYKLPAKELQGPKVIDKLLNLLLDMRNFINEIELYPKQSEDVDTQNQSITVDEEEWPKS